MRIESGGRIAEDSGPRQGLFGFLKEEAWNVCDRKLRRDELKMVMPSSFFETNNAPVKKRYLCRTCYIKFARKSAASRAQRSAEYDQRDLKVYSIEA